jgi:ParB family chromosome partitioning protein
LESWEGVAVADKMWDILRFLKNPEGELLRDDAASSSVEAEKKQIDAQLMDAVEKTERAVDEAVAAESADADVIETGSEGGAADESIVASNRTEAQGPPEAEHPADSPRAMGGQEKAQAAPLEAADAEDRRLPSSADESPGSGDGDRLLKIRISSIKPNPYQPRRAMGENEITELSESIRELGVLQPILVKRGDSGYELIAGERRMRAAQRAGLTEIPAVLLETEPLTQQIIALVENIQRKNLSAIEEAACLQDIISKTGWSQTELSRRMGRSQASIANKLRLLRLDPSVQDLVISGKLGERQARSLLSLSMEEQRQLAQRAVDDDLSARALETLAENWNSRSHDSRKSEKKKPETSDGPAGELLGDLAALINKHRSNGISAQWRVKQMNQSSLVVEISVDLMENAGKDIEVTD